MKHKRLNEFEIKQLWTGIYAPSQGIKYESVDQAVRLLWKTYKKNNPELLIYFKEFTLIESSKIKEEILQIIAVNPGMKIKDIYHHGLMTLEAIKTVIDAIENENKYLNINTQKTMHTYTIPWNKIKTELNKISDPIKQLDYLIYKKQEFMKFNNSAEANQVIIWFNDEIENVRFIISENNKKINSGFKSDITIRFKFFKQIFIGNSNTRN